MDRVKYTSCLRCDVEFKAMSGWSTQLYCSNECNFLDNFVKGSPEQCWEWTGRKDQKGYGYFGHAWSAYRYSYEYFKSPRENGKVIRHLCNNPGCVNPSHLEKGTHLDNSDDRKVLGPIIGLQGEKNGCVKLSNEQVLEIYNSKEDYKVVADRFNISRARVRDILNGRGWNHITGAPKFTPKKIYKKRVK